MPQRFFQSHYRRSHPLLKRIGDIFGVRTVLDPNPPWGDVSLETIREYIKDKNMIMIGNSESLLNMYQGKLIDKFDLIIRFNEGFMLPEIVEHTGVKTHIWVCGLYQERRIKRGFDYFKDCDYILRLNAKHFQYTPTYIKPKTFAYRSHMEFNKLEQEIQSRSGTPSTGISSIDFFVNYAKTYKTITLIGFDFFKQPTYYAAENYKSPHNDITEKAFVMKHKLTARIIIK